MIPQVRGVFFALPMNLYKRGKTLPRVSYRNLVSACALALLLSGCDNMNSSETYDGTPSGHRGPALVTTNAPAPDVIYRRGSRDAVLATGDTSAAMHTEPFYTSHVETPVTHQVDALDRELGGLTAANAGYRERLDALQAKSDSDAAQYYEIV